MTFETIDLTIADRVARVTLDRPEAGNAFNLTLARELAEAAMRCDADPGVRAVLLTANGRMFSVGGDLKAFSGFGEQAPLRLKEIADELHRATSVLRRMAAPVVVAVQGPAAGAGFSLAVGGDYVLAGESAKFTMAYTAAGLSPDGGSTFTLPRLIGLRRTQELMFDNRTLSAAEAHEWGLVTKVLPDDDLAAGASEVATRLAAGPLVAHGNVKRLLAETFGNGLETQMELEGRGIAHAVSTAEGIEGITAFLEKRRPRW